MAARSSWKGYLKLSLVSVPVKAYTSTASGGGDIQLNQLHADCNSRIQYKKSCPIHGEVKGDQIVSGYEYSKDHYVIIDTSELDKLRTEDDKAIKIDAFVPIDTVDPAYFSGKSYYLVPDGPIGQRPFQVVCQGMIDEKCYGIAQVVFHNREQLVLLRPVGNLLAMSILNFDSQVTKPAAFADEVPRLEVSDEELDLAKTLIRASKPKKFDLAKYQDVYTQKLTKLIEAKVAGQEIVAAPATEQPHVINLMEALKKSVAEAQKASGTQEPAAAEKPPKKMASSSRGWAAARKKKTS
jgi:DNA end-binding protein Ku